jgi:hypothetical protein
LLCSETAEECQCFVGPRAELKKALFRCFDIDGDGFLKDDEARNFAEALGFRGTDEEWNDEYKNLCAEYGQDERDGIPWYAISWLLDTAPDEGLGCSNE